MAVHANSFTSYTGVGVNGTAYVKNWQLGVAGYLSGGNFQYKSTRYDLLPGQNGEVDVTIRQAIGGRIFVRPPVPGLLVGLSGVAGQISTCPIVVAMVPCQSNIRGRQGSAQLEYLSDRVWFRSEAALIEGPGFLASRGGYVQGAFFLSRKWQIAAQHDVLRETLKVPELSGPLAPLFPRALDTHSDNSIGLNYWFSPDMVVKWSVHDVRGWRFANPGRNVMLQGLQTQQFPDVRSRLLQAGIQFNF